MNMNWAVSIVGTFVVVTIGRTQVVPAGTFMSHVDNFKIDDLAFAMLTNNLLPLARDAKRNSGVNSFGYCF